MIGSTVTPSGSTASINWNGLDENTEYEWYVTVSNGGTPTQGLVWEFQTDISTTSVNCGGGSPSVTYGSSLSCVAVVTNSSSSDTPTGTVSWSTSGSGTFVTSPCTLSGSGGSATCSVTYTPNSVGSGSHIITANYSGDGEFSSSAGNQSVTVNKRTLIPSVTASNKVYDGITSAAISSWTLSGIVGSDAVTLVISAATFSDKNVGNGKTVTASGLTLGGTHAGNYQLSTTSAVTTANITPASLTISANNDSKTYNGLAYSGGNGVTYSGFVGSDNESNALSGTLTYSGSSQGAVNQGVYTILPGGLTANNGNYTINFVGGTLTINPATLTVTADDQTIIVHNPLPSTYTFQYSGFMGSDDASDLTTEPLCNAPSANKDVIGDYPITCSGGVAINYDFNYVDGILHVVAPNPSVLTVNPVSGTYGGTVNVSATLRDANTNAPIIGAVVTFKFNGVFAGSAITNSSETAALNSVSLAGVDAGIYPSGMEANFAGNSTYAFSSDTDVLTVNQKALIPYITVANKTYDGTTTATILSRSVSGIVSGDSVSLSGGTASFSDKNVGSAKTVIGSGFTLTGPDASNYYLSPATATTSASILIRGLTVTATGIDKVYDGTTTAIVTLTTDAVPGDQINTAYTSAVFPDKNVGASQNISVAGISINGPDAANYYLLNTTATASASILPRNLNVLVTALDKTYDGTTNASITISSDKLAGDEVSLSYMAANFDNKNVGNDKTVTVSGIAISGSDAGNYTVNPTAFATADIAPRAISIAANAGKSKTFGTPAPVLTYTVTSGALVSGDSFSGALSRIPGESSGTYPITIGTLTAGSNYNLSFVSADFTILPPTSPRFADVPLSYWAWSAVESIAHAGITSGCDSSNFCPTAQVTRAQMAIFLLRGIHGSTYTPPAPSGTLFADVPASYWAAAWIEQLANENITSGCGGGNFETPVTRDQMAVFLQRTFDLPHP